jgi:hypothetical protein
MLAVNDLASHVGMEADSPRSLDALKGTPLLSALELYRPMWHN